MDSKKQLWTKLERFDQQHLLRFWDKLDANEKCLLEKDINDIDLNEVVNFFKQATDEHASEKKLDSVMKPVPAEIHGSLARTNDEQLQEYENRGFKEIADNHVGVLLLAGGQGTRLGVSYPKGMYNVGLPSGKTLFQIQAERILVLQNLAKAKFLESSESCRITWYIMTSDATMEETKEFFVKHDYFGLDENNVVMFEQSMLPCFDFNGKILLQSKNKLAKSPDGNGGLYRALKERNIFQHMDARGVKYLHVYCVDNILVKVADPVFIGYCLSKGSDCAAKVVEKVSSDEPIGVVCDVGGKLQVVEYSEISEATARRREPDGRLTFNAGNICNHFFTSEFLKNVANEHECKLKLHIAKKKIPHVDDEGNFIRPDTPNGVKIEKFVFDVFPFASNFVIWEVPREEEFSALKNSNSTNKDNSITAKEDIYRLHRRYITNAGGVIVGDKPCEISPLLSYAGENLHKICKGKVFEDPVITLYAPTEKNYQQNGFH